MAENLFDGEIVAVKYREQLGVFLLDGSGSMSDIGEANMTLAENVNSTFKDFISLFKQSSIRKEFEIAVINFDYEATVRVGRTPLTEFDEFGDYDPRDPDKDNPGTFIGAGLLKAKEIIDDYFAQPNPDEYPRTAVIAILSDGMCQHPEKTLPIARQLDSNPNITISSGLFTVLAREGDSDTKDAKNFLQQVKSKDGTYGVIRDNAALRRFFNASMSSSKKRDH
ncbi:MAG: hypothetical protein LBN95_08365 [Prevotellaceae bacterium]|jgi:uncharacterized protein YegL|nr:hypothetical protein [Prevotellaceae bacterium]